MQEYICYDSFVFKMPYILLNEYFKFSSGLADMILFRIEELFQFRY